MKVTNGSDACCDECDRMGRNPDTGLRKCVAFTWDEELCDCILYSAVDDTHPKEKIDAYFCQG